MLPMSTQPTQRPNIAIPQEMPKLMVYGFLNTLVQCFAVAVFLTLAGVSSVTGALQVALLARRL